MKANDLFQKLAVAMLGIACCALFAMGQTGPAASLSTRKDAAKTQNDPEVPNSTGMSSEKSVENSPVIVIGFVGGFVGHDNMVHSPVQIAAHLREAHPSGVYVR